MRWRYDTDPFRPRLTRRFALFPVSLEHTDRRAWLEYVWCVTEWGGSYEGMLAFRKYFAIPEDEAAARDA